VVVEAAAEVVVVLPAVVVETDETIELVELAGLDEVGGIDVGGFVFGIIVAALGALFESTCPLPATLFGLL